MIRLANDDEPVMSSIREHPTRTDGERPRRRWAFLISPGWIAVILAVLAFAAACFWILSPWQFGRNSERSAQNAAIAAAITASAVPVTDLLSGTGQPPEDVSWRVVTATGQFDPEPQIQVRLRQDGQGQPVSEVIAIFELADGRSLLVDRGYVSFADVQAGVPIAPLPTGQVTITGRVQAEQIDPSNRPPVVVGDRTEAYAISASAFGDLASSEDLLDGYIQLIPGSPGVLTPIDVPQTDDGPFLSYALQWAAFGVIALIGLCVFIFREAADPRPPDDRTQPGATDLTNPSEAGGNSDKVNKRRRRSKDGFDRSQLYDA
jgi:cytochrome oxidase assembly protein ShyY1